MNDDNNITKDYAKIFKFKNISKVELTLLGIFIISIILLLISLPGGSMLMILSLGTLSFFYFYFGFAILNGITLRNIFKKKCYSGISSMRIVGAIGVGISLSMLNIGILFKLMSWPGSSFMLLVGLISISVFFAYSLIKIIINRSSFYANILFRTAFFGSIGLLLLILPSYTLSEIRYGKHHPEYIEALKALENDPTNTELQDNVTKEYNKIKRLNGERIEDNN